MRRAAVVFALVGLFGLSPGPAALAQDAPTAELSPEEAAAAPAADAAACSAWPWAWAIAWSPWGSPSRRGGGGR
jgi:hypothetical protein